MRGGIELRQRCRRLAALRAFGCRTDRRYVLLMAPLATPSEARDYAYVRLHYLDGSSAVLPIRTSAMCGNVRKRPADADRLGVRRFLRLVACRDGATAIRAC
jgi:hypothetical protein